jgi:ABC-type bacteriocin/lantibiotic exporter with double-glycine peptidase domain
VRVCVYFSPGADNLHMGAIVNRHAFAGAPATEAHQAAVTVQGGSFTWDVNAEPILRDINLRIKPGQFVVIVGRVGCGKSSLLAALLREMPTLAGAVNVRGSVAYTAQDPWIQNSTVEGNILMGMPMDRRRYQKVVAACAMASDLEMLPAGDQTEIGEKGVNLSGALLCGEGARVPYSECQQSAPFKQRCRCCSCSSGCLV